MNKLTDLEDVPFVNEECGDTMWDEAQLNQLTGSTSSQTLPTQSIQVNSTKEQVSDIYIYTSVREGLK